MARVTLVVGMLALYLLPARVRADISPQPAPPQCDTRTAGSDCDLPAGGPGKCVAARCSDLDYSQGSPPRTIERDCLQCQPAPATSAAQPAPAPAAAPAAPPNPPEVESRCAVDPATGSLATLLGLVAAARRRRRRSP